jgi:hypothetical protein
VCLCDARFVSHPADFGYQSPREMTCCYGFAGLDHRHQRSLQRLSGHHSPEGGIVDEKRIALGPERLDARAVQRIAIVAALALVVRAD